MDLRAVFVRSTVPAFALCAVAACASGLGIFPPDSVARPTRAVPDQFAPATAVASGGANAPACLSPLTDPRDGTSLRLVRSQGGTRGDYEVPAGKYGMAADELLRVDCTTNRAIGVVPRGPR